MDRKFKMVNATKKPFVVPRYRRGTQRITILFDAASRTLSPQSSQAQEPSSSTTRCARRGNDPLRWNRFFGRLGQSLVRLLRRLHCVPRKTDETRHAARLTISEISLARRRSRPISHPRLVVVHARHLCRRSRSSLCIVIRKQTETARRG